MEMQRSTGWIRLILLALAFGTMSLLAACGSDSTAGSPASLSFSATTGSTVLGYSARMATLAGGEVVDVFNMGVAKIELEQDMDVEVDDSGVEFEGSFIVDLLAGTIENIATGGAATAIVGVLPPGTYEEVEFELTPLPGVGAAGASGALYIAGSYGTPGPNTYEISINVPVKVEVEGPQGIALDGATNDLIVAFRLDTLLSATSLESIRPYATTDDETNWTLVITDVLDPALAALELELKSALEFGEDHDGNHDLDEAEDVDDDSMM
jgi:hypothetical protein